MLLLQTGGMVKQIAPSASATPMFFTLFIRRYERPACGFIPLYLARADKIYFRE
jgi:hypothetical protein